MKSNLDYSMQDFSVVESGIVDSGIRNSVQGIRNPSNGWNPESRFYWQGIWNPVDGGGEWLSRTQYCSGLPYIGRNRATSGNCKRQIKAPVRCIDNRDLTKLRRRRRQRQRQKSSRFSSQNNNSACFFVHFFAVPARTTTTWNGKIVSKFCFRTRTARR